LRAGSLDSGPVLATFDFTVPFRSEHGFDGLYGLLITEIADDRVSGEVEVHDRLRQPAGLVHGGVYAAIAESLASIATARVVMAEGKVAQGLSNQTSFLRPIVAGTIHAVGIRKHRGRGTWVWEIEMSDDQGRLCVLTRMTVAVRELPAPSA
jgi:1,4-dihydroxy-2-naphthoyl-CoA hydrolase